MLLNSLSTPSDLNYQFLNTRPKYDDTAYHWGAPVAYSESFPLPADRDYNSHHISHTESETRGGGGTLLSFASMASIVVVDLWSSYWARNSARPLRLFCMHRTDSTTFWVLNRHSGSVTPFPIVAMVRWLDGWLWPTAQIWALRTKNGKWNGIFLMMTPVRLCQIVNSFLDGGVLYGSLPSSSRCNKFVDAKGIYSDKSK